MHHSEYIQKSFDVLKDTGNYNRWILENIEDALGKRILEIGCGTGNMMDLLIGPGREVTGIDIEESFVAQARQKYAGNEKVRILSGDFLKLATPGSFDTAVLINVLEHIEKDREAVEKIHGLLSAGGRIAALVPAWPAAYGRLDENFGHFRRYSKKDVRALYEGVGFEVERLYYMNFPGAFGWFLHSRILRKGTLSPGQARFYDRFVVPLQRVAEGFVKPPIGQSLIAIGRK